MTNRAPDVFHKIELLVDDDPNYKQLLIDGRVVWHVKDVDVHVSTDPLTEVVVTFYTDQFAMTRASLPRDGVDD